MTLYPTRECADMVAEYARERESDGWTYEVRPHGASGRYVIVVVDADGFELGPLP
jgi:hypothetical protein